MKPSFKYAVIHRHRTKYAVKDLCEILQISRSGYYKYELLSEIRRRKRWRKMGEDKHRYDNWLNREFNAEHPNQKWVTDISYINHERIQLKTGLSPLSLRQPG